MSAPEVFVLRTRNRGTIELQLHVEEACVDKIEPLTSSKGKNVRQIFMRGEHGERDFRIGNPTIGVKEGHEIRAVYYRAQGFIQKIAGFHNLSKKGTYVLTQPKDYFQNWLHVRSDTDIWMMCVVPCVLSACALLISLIACMLSFVVCAIAAYVLYKRLSKKYVYVSAVHLKSMQLQLIAAFKQLSPQDL